jgi:hypothetical protein
MRVLNVIGFVIVFIIASPIILIGSGITYIHDKLNLTSFIKENSGKKYFIYSNKHNWGTFIQNNVLDILTPDFTPLCFENKETKRFVQKTNTIFKSSRIQGNSKMPYFSVIDDFKIVNYSIHSMFLSHRFDNRKNDIYRQEVREFIDKINGVQHRV